MRNPYIDKISNYIKDNKLATFDDIILVGLSGGADSVALLLILNELGYKCIATHCNFHLRGEESNRDEKFCVDICESTGIKLLKKDFDVTGFRESFGGSVEMACRDLRYEWWESIIEEGTATLIAVGHHIEDNIETFFINMLRGCGLKGLKGILPKSGSVIRPLLASTRAEIEAYLSSKEIRYVTDSTNYENEYARNRIRNIILPEIEKCFPGGMSSINKTITNLRANYDFYIDSVKIFREKYFIGGKVINLSQLIAEESHPHIVLFELLSPMGFNMTHVENIIVCNNDNISGKYFYSDRCTLLLDRGRLSICVPDMETLSEIPQKISIFETPFSSRTIPKKQFDMLKAEGKLHSGTLYLDAKILEDKPIFTLRKWKAGDKMAPFGMKGTKLVSDIFNDSKLSVEEKKLKEILLWNDTIIWIIGLRTSRHFAVTDKTSSVLVIDYNPTKN